ncbi:MAG TPA: hypothetical protein VMW65_02165, partial [Chloroflexota bacterium]|nr:hypothetical protein [Chloroflexota bacterium]
MDSRRLRKLFGLVLVLALFQTLLPLFEAQAEGNRPGISLSSPVDRTTPLTGRLTTASSDHEAADREYRLFLPRATANTDACAGIFGPGFWKNYQNHFTDDQFYTLLTRTIDFGPTFAAAPQQDAIALAETIINLPGYEYVRSELTAELNV